MNVAAKQRIDSKQESTGLIKRKPTKHACELFRGSDSNLPKLQPNAKMHARMKRFFQKMILVSSDNPTTRLYLRSNAAITAEKRRHGRSQHWWIIHPCSYFRFIWEIVTTMTLLYCFVQIPYISMFHMLHFERSFDEDKTLLPAFTICGMDIVFNFITGFVSRNSHDIHLDPAIIARHYATGYFVLDLITSIPYTWIIHGYDSPWRDLEIDELYPFALRMVEMLPLMKLFKCYALKKYMKHIFMAMSMNNTNAVIVWLGFFTVFICHWSACFRYGFPLAVMHATGTTLEDSGAWFTQNVTIMQDRNNFEVYLLSLHMGVSSLCASSSNVLLELDSEIIESLEDRFTGSVLLVCGMVYQIHLIVIALQFTESHDAPVTKYEQMMNDLKRYMHQKNISPELRKKLISYYEFRFRGSYFKENVILSSLPDHLKTEILVHTCRRLLDSVTIFWNLPRALLETIIAALKPEIYLKDDVIYTSSTEGNSMYFIGNGTVATITYSGKEICHLHDGAFFGHESLIFPNCTRLFTVIAIEECEIFRLDRSDFKRLIPANSELFFRLQSVVQEQRSITTNIEKLDNND